MLNDSIKAIQEQLQDGIAKGYWTLEQLDKPSAGWVANTHVDLRSFPDGYQGIQHRNLLRDYHPEQVQAAPDPHDFAQPGSDIRPGPTPIPVEGDFGSVFSDGRDQLGHQPGSRSSNSEGQAELGAEGEQDSQLSRSVLDW